MRLFKKTDIDFLGNKWPFIGLSIALSLVTLVSLIAKKGPNWGIDFTGGSQIVVAFTKAPDENQIRKIVEGASVKVESVQRFDKAEKNQVLVRVPQEKKEGRDVSKEVIAALTGAMFPEGARPETFDLNLNGAEPLVAKLVRDDPEQVSQKPGLDPKIEYGRIADALIKARSEKILYKSHDEATRVAGVSPVVATWLKEKTVVGPFTLLSAETVGPQVGKDLRQKGMWAVLLSWAAMLTYIALRFRSASFGTAAVIALIHDSWVTLGFCSLLNTEISLTVVAAFLTLIGYSVNDTVVIFDRIRENREKAKKEPLVPLVNRSLNETLSRTVLTSGLTFLVVVALFFFGGEVLRPFSFVMLIGIIIGTYSSLFIAAPIVIAWEEKAASRTKSTPSPAPTASPKAPGKLSAGKGR